ncbi:MAG: hypothetical protein AAGF93_16310 [Cyanobacteria bacterium P01_H01_bin.105]
MIRHLALASVLAIGSSVILAPTAKADSADVPFDGTVPAFCILDNVQAGTLAAVGTPAVELDSRAPGGTSGSVDLTCNSASTVQVDTVKKTAGPAINPFNTMTWLNGGIGVVNYAGPVVGQQIDVDLKVDQGGALLPPGDYEFEVTVTATP